jgi:photosystem II stability/assembly factor-like uncharacterized protein
MGTILLATSHGLIVAESSPAGQQNLRLSLEHQHVTSVIAREGVILAGTRQGVFRSTDLGTSWQAASQGLDLPYVRWLSYHPQVSDCEFAGSEPAAIFTSRDGGHTWRACPEVADMRQQYSWSLPYSPEAGCVRGFAFNGERAFAAVEDGAVLVSNDQGQSWALAGGSRGAADHWPQAGQVHSDVHSIEVHPNDPNLVLAPTGGGLYLSQDGGDSWDLLYRCYCRAAWMDSADPAHLVFGPAEGVDRRVQILESHDSGKSWQPVVEGLSVPWEHTMVERLAHIDQELFAVLSDGRLYRAHLPELHWQQAFPTEAGIHAVAIMVD